MAKVKLPVESRKKIRPALSPEAREAQLQALAVDLVEQRLIDGTATSQETTHFLKQASLKAKYELERLKLENELIKAKTEAIQADKRNGEFYDKVLNALKLYNGQGGTEEDDY